MVDLMGSVFAPPTIAVFVHAAFVIVFVGRVIMKRPATGVALAWLLLVVTVPYVGAALYFMVGERRIGRLRAERIGILRADYQKICDHAIRNGLTNVDWSRHTAVARGMDRLGRQMGAAPTVCGSDVRLFDDTKTILRAIVADVDAAKTSVLMEFYIWNVGGAADAVLEAVIRAAHRGVSCRLLIDALGARPWWKSPQPQQLRAAGVELQASLPVGIFRTFVGRTDLRNHRKIVVIDGAIAWTGSMNMVDPQFFKQDSGVGQWVDAMVRLQGAVVAPLAATMIGDWTLETGEPLEKLIESAGLGFVAGKGPADIQVMPSGPGQTKDGLLQMILSLIKAAQNELILTTPYLVPDESLLRAIRGAAASGVRVALIVPEKVDSLMARYASRSFYDDLLEVGVEIYLFRGGLLHTKSIMVDGAMAMFGTVNLDMRSLWINYEVALFAYDPEFARELRSLQQTYIDDSSLLDPQQWQARSSQSRFLENVMRLVSPLL